ncbi:hypothetical protein EIP86_011270 [Pleurotus ostreatoroseus]|nr:hypothetical protein EIP86_011270 [Pleurotus ostreatoroseus]
MEALDTVSWTLADLLYFIFRIKDENGQDVRRERSHATAVSHFLSGRTLHSFIEILDNIWKDPAGRPRPENEEYDLAYSTLTPYTSIRYARPAISSFCVQTIKAKMLKERNRAVRTASGLHGSVPGARRGSQRSISWKDIGSESISTVMGILKRYQPLTWDILFALVTPRTRRQNGQVVSRKRRPPDVTTYRTLKRLASQRAQELRELGRDTSRGVFMRIDNVQQYFKQWENRIGRVNEMKIGISGYVAEAVDYDANIINMDDVHAKIKENLRAKLTVEKLLDLVDWDHQETVGALQWLMTLVKLVPTLAHLRSRVAEMYRTKGAKKLLPRTRKTKIWPLATSGKNEAITTELRDAMHDFLNQLGQTRDSHTARRPIYSGGDGMTFEKKINLKLASQFLTNPFDRGDDIQPFLENWHAEWTFVGLVFETHWGQALTEDPSKLGYSATKIGQKGPSNLKKPDYYPSIYLLYTVLDARMLDCWRIYFGCDDLKGHFAQLEADKHLPSIDELESIARTLYRRYSSQQAYHRALYGTMEESVNNEMFIPHGSSWKPPQRDASSIPKSAGSAKKKKPAGLTAQYLESEEFKGDQVLAHSIMFMHDAILAREMALAVPEGDPGRVYEAMKRTMFSFWGSDHARYASYTLEQVCNLEYESTEPVREMFLSNWLINPTGTPGGYKQGDTVIEGQNRELQGQMGHKDTEWDSTLSRQVVSLNIDKLTEVKNTFNEGTGLAKRRKAHTSPHSRPEYDILLRTYKESEPHLFKPGRRCISTKELDINTFGNGVRQLYSGKLQKWIRKTMQMRVLHEGERLYEPSTTVETADAEDEEDSDLDIDEEVRMTRGSIQLMEGDIEVEVGDEYLDVEGDPEEDWITDEDELEDSNEM